MPANTSQELNISAAEVWAPSSGLSANGAQIFLNYSDLSISNALQLARSQNIPETC